MLQDVDGAGLLLFLWAVMIWWWICGLASNSSLEQQGEESQEPAPPRPERDVEAPMPSIGRVPSDMRGIVSEVLRRDGCSNLDELLAKTTEIYEKVVAAYNEGNRDTLRKLVSPEVYEVFSDAIAAREIPQGAGEFVFSRIETPEIVEGAIGDAHMEVSIRFVGDSFRLVRDAGGEVVGTVGGARRTVDVWTFERRLAARGRWRVGGTEAG